MSKDYIPRNAAQFRFFMSPIMEYTTKMSPEWTAIPHDRIDELYAAFKVFTTAFDLVVADPTPGNIHARNAAQKEAVRLLRAFINQFLRYDPVVTDTDRVEMGLPVRDTIRTPSPVPASVPEIEANTSVIRELSLRLRDFGAKTWGKPAHVRSMELAWGIRENRPAEVAEFPHLESATANPIVLSFEEEARGKRVFFAARWLNNTAQPGPWSDIESAVVP
jgi:hypothetical protein